MRYEVSEKFFNMLSALYTTALEDGNEYEIEMALGLILDTARGQDEM